MNTVDAIRFLAGIGMAVPLPEDRDAMAAYGPMVPITASQLPTMPYPANDSLETQKELDYLVKLQRKKPVTDFDKLVDEDLIAPFVTYAKEHGLDVEREYLSELIRAALPIILDLKYRYARPRPKQLAFMYGVDLAPYLSKTANSPSYPSGHSFQAYLVAYVLGSRYPAHQRALEAIAERVGQARANMGLHFPSDLEAGRAFAKIVAQSVAR